MMKSIFFLMLLTVGCASCGPNVPAVPGPGVQVGTQLPRPVPSKWLKSSTTLQGRGLLYRTREPRAEDTDDTELPAQCSNKTTRYPSDSTHSPITCGVANRLRALLANRAVPHPQIFMKVGDSISATPEFLDCFETQEMDFAVNENATLQAAWQWYLNGNLGSTTSYARRSYATRASQTAQWVLGGDPSPLSLEVQAIDPSVALVMFGTNDIYYGGHAAPASMKFPWMYSQMKRLLEDLMQRGIVPILYSIPPYAGAHWQLKTLVASYNAVLRGLAEGKQIPFVDYYARMQDLPGQGLRDDGVHPNTKSGAPCDFTPEGLHYGHNLRNLLTLQALNRVWQVTERSEERSHWEETGAPETLGRGTLADPIRVHGTHFARFDTLQTDAENQFAEITCGKSDVVTSARGREKVFQVTFAEPTPARVMLLRSSSKNMNLYWLQSANENDCVKSTSVMFRGLFPPGTHYFVVDAAEPEEEDEFLFLSAVCDPEDARCQEAP